MNNIKHINNNITIGNNRFGWPVKTNLNSLTKEGVLIFGGTGSGRERVKLTFVEEPVKSGAKGLIVNSDTVEGYMDLANLHMDINQIKAPSDVLSYAFAGRIGEGGSESKVITTTAKKYVSQKKPVDKEALAASFSHFKHELCEDQKTRFILLSNTIDVDPEWLAEQIVKLREEFNIFPILSIDSDFFLKWYQEYGDSVFILTDVLKHRFMMKNWLCSDNPLAVDIMNRIVEFEHFPLNTDLSRLEAGNAFYCYGPKKKPIDMRIVW